MSGRVGFPSGRDGCKAPRVKTKICIARGVRNTCGAVFAPIAFRHADRSVCSYGELHPGQSHEHSAVLGRSDWFLDAGGLRTAMGGRQTFFHELCGEPTKED